jgi:hypothetical protein
VKGDRGDRKKEQDKWNSFAARLPEMLSLFWQENNMVTRIDSLPPAIRKDYCLNLLYQPSYPFKEEVWQKIISQGPLSKFDLMGIVKWVPELRERAGMIILDNNPTKDQLLMVRFLVPNLSEKAKKIFLEEEFNFTDLITLTGIDPIFLAMLLGVDPKINNEKLPVDKAIVRRLFAL